MADPDLERILGELLKKREQLATLTWNERDDTPEPAGASAEDAVTATDPDPESALDSEASSAT